MDKDTFQKLCKEAGFKRKYDLALTLGISYSAVNAWGSVKPYPKYVKPYLLAMCKARKYDALVASGVIKD